MTIEPKSARLSPKELAKQFRQNAYQRAKEFRKTDPRQIAMAEKIKEKRKEAYKKAKERDKAYRAGIKKVSLAKPAAKKDSAKQKQMGKMVMRAHTIV